VAIAAETKDVFMGRGQSGRSTSNTENAARAAVDSAAGRTQTDPEWGRTRSKLVEFVATLRSWEQKAKKDSAGLGNVEALCQPET
jgi:hypothetical protein